MAPALTNRFPRKKVAIVGSGAAGIAALWALNRTHHDVYLYEAGPRLGGHTNTVEWKHGKSRTSVDTGFIVLNTATYPNFIAFLKHIKVPTVKTDMTFGVSRDYGAFEWSGTSLGAVFTQRRNIFSPRMWRMIFDIIRFNQFALDLLKHEEDSQASTNGNGVAYTNGDTHSHQARGQETIGDYLQRNGYSDAFRDDYLIPMTAAVWSTSPDKCSLEFPAVTLVRFMWNHHLLSTVAARPDWLTLKHCAKSYVDHVMHNFPSNHLFLNTSIRSVTNTSSGKVQLRLDDDSTAEYDHVILACHGDTSAKIISASATPIEASIMSNFKTSQNTAILHNDLTLMPKRRKAWAAWNYMTLTSSSAPSLTPGKRSRAQPASKSGSGGNIDQVCLTYNMNILQHIPTQTFGNVLVTLNPLHMPSPEKIQGHYTYAHPLYTASAIHAQSLLPSIQNTRGISYAGAWTNYGFHEDAFSSGLKVAMDHLGAKLPFEFRDSTFSRGRKPRLGFGDLLLRLCIIWVQVFVVRVLEFLFGVRRGVGVGVGVGGERERGKEVVAGMKKGAKHGYYERLNGVDGTNGINGTTNGINGTHTTNDIKKARKTLKVV